MAEYDYLAVDCKNPACGRRVLIYLLSEHSDFLQHIVEGDETIEVRCNACGLCDSYRRSEIFSVTAGEPPDDFADHPKIRPRTN